MISPPPLAIPKVTTKNALTVKRMINIQMFPLQKLNDCERETHLVMQQDDQEQKKNAQHDSMTATKTFTINNSKRQ